MTIFPGRCPEIFFVYGQTGRRLCYYLIMINLDVRLSMAADLVEKCSVLADIGSDHGYLPVNLLQRGIIERAVITDVNRGPLDNALRTASRVGLTDRCTFIKGSGFEALSGCPSPDVISVCGMGGELISSFIVEREDIAGKSILVLQPMNNMAVLLRCLHEKGFCVSGESMVRDGYHFYQCVRAEYDGTVRSFADPYDYEFMPALVDRRDPVMREYLLSRLETERKIFSAMDGKELKDPSQAENTAGRIRAIEERLEKYDTQGNHQHHQ